MCGIAGILRVWPAHQRDAALATPPVRSIPEPWLDTLDDAIKHRGPDGRGRFRDRALRADGCVVDVAFVHRRLSIIDHAGGHQPMLSLGKAQGVVTNSKRLALGAGLGLYERDAASELIAEPSSLSSADADRVCVIFNGCIYNHRELRAELQRAGHVFSTDHSDTEVLVHGWREWQVGPAPVLDYPSGGSIVLHRFFDRLDGMMAVGLWDSAKGTLALARDHAGEKPLYLLKSEPGESGSIVAFSSAMPGLCALAQSLSSRGLAIESEELRRWIRFGFGQARIVRGVREVLGGNSEFFPSHPDAHQAAHFVPRFDRGRTPTSDDLDSLLSDAVSSRLEADVPIGCFLSGGVDSSLIAHYAKRSRSDLNTFCVRMPDQAYDESAFASQVAQHLGTSHTTLDCEAHPVQDLQDLLLEIGLPFGDSSLLPTAWLSRAARRHVAVAIAGDGGDELFLGYQRYMAARWLSRFRPLLALAYPLTRASSRAKSNAAKMHRLAAAAWADGYDDLLAIFPKDSYEQLAGTTLGPAPLATRRFRPQDGVAKQRALEDVCSYLPDDILRKTDTASMHVALEVRAPFLAQSVIHAAIAAPERKLLLKGQRKGLLRDVARKYLPASIVDRPKMGFAIPIGEWFRSDFGGLRTMLLDHLNSSEPFGSPSLGIDLNRAFIRRMLDEHLGTGPSGAVVRDHSQRLYMLLVLSIWSKSISSLR